MGGKREGGPLPRDWEDALLRKKTGSSAKRCSLPENTAISPGACSALHAGAGCIFLYTPPVRPSPAVYFGDSWSFKVLSVANGYFCASTAIPATSDCAVSAPQPCTAPPPALFLAANSWNNYFCLSAVGSLDLELSKTCSSGSLAATAPSPTAGRAAGGLGEPPRRPLGSVSVIVLTRNAARQQAEWAELSVEDAKDLEPGFNAGHKLCFEAACMLMWCHLFGKDLGSSSWDFLKTSQGKFQDSGFSKGGLGFHLQVSISVPVLLRGLGLHKECKRFMQMWLPNASTSPTVVGNEPTPLALQSFDFNISYSIQFPWTTTKEDYEKTPPQSLRTVSCADPSRRTKSPLKLFQKGFLLLFISLPALPPVVWDPSENNSVCMHWAGKE